MHGVYYLLRITHSSAWCRYNPWNVGSETWEQLSSCMAAVPIPQVLGRAIKPWDPSSYTHPWKESANQSVLLLWEAVAFPTSCRYSKFKLFHLKVIFKVKLVVVHISAPTSPWVSYICTLLTDTAFHHWLLSVASSTWFNLPVYSFLESIKNSCLSLWHIHLKLKMKSKIRCQTSIIHRSFLIVGWILSRIAAPCKKSGELVICFLFLHEQSSL